MWWSQKASGTEKLAVNHINYDLHVFVSLVYVFIAKSNFCFIFSDILFRMLKYFN